VKSRQANKKVLARGVAAGALLDLAIGGLTAPVIAMKPGPFAGLIH
jgi:hypothetical protein